MYPHIDPLSGIARISSANMILKRWHNKSVSKARPALAPFVPRMLKEAIAQGAPRYGPRRKVRNADELTPEPDTSAKSECLPACAHIEQADVDQGLTSLCIPLSTAKPENLTCQPNGESLLPCTKPRRVQLSMLPCQCCVIATMQPS